MSKRTPKIRKKPRALKTADGRLVAFARVLDDGVLRPDIRVSSCTKGREPKRTYGYD